jgi:ribosomal protein S18 acetylase RimI-like enzyme
MIAVAPAEQRTGRGAALLAHIEEALAAAGQRLLLVETSSSAEYERARAFYKRCGFGQEARIRDYFAAGEDMILFRKALGPAKRSGVS